MIKKIGMADIRVNKVKGSNYCIDVDGIHHTLKYEALKGQGEPFTLYDYMELTNKEITEASEELVKTGAYLLGHNFKVYFFNKEDCKRFLKI